MKFSVERLQKMARNTNLGEGLRRWAKEKLGRGGPKKVGGTTHTSRGKKYGITLMAKHRGHGRSKSSGGVGSKIVGAVGYGFAEPILNSLAAKVGVGLPDEIVKAGVGYYLATKQSGILRDIGVAALTISAYKLSKGGLAIGQTGSVSVGVQVIS